MLFFLLICLYLLFRLSQGPYKENIFWPYIIKICLLAIFIGKTDAEAEAPILWLPDVKSHSLEKTLMLGKTEGRRRRG